MSIYPQKWLFPLPKSTPYLCLFCIVICYMNNLVLTALASKFKIHKPSFSSLKRSDILPVIVWLMLNAYETQRIWKSWRISTRALLHFSALLCKPALPRLVKPVILPHLNGNLMCSSVNRSGNDETQNRSVRVDHTETTYDIGMVSLSRAVLNRWQDLIREWECVTFREDPREKKILNTLGNCLVWWLPISFCRNSRCKFRFLF